MAGEWRYGNQRERVEFEQASFDEITRGRLIVTGPLPQERMNDLFSRAKVFLRFGIEEAGPGMGILQALSYGLPIVTNSTLGMAETIEKFGCGIVLDEPDPVRAAEWVNALLQSNSMFQDLSSRSLAAARSLTWTAHSDRLYRAMVDVRDQKIKSSERSTGKV